MAFAPIAISRGSDHHFHVAGSPVSVNRYGTKHYRDWRGQVYTASVPPPGWAGTRFPGDCSVWIRYFNWKDRAKDVDNILKAILDGLDGKAGRAPKHNVRVLHDDRHVQYVVSMRTKLRYGTRISARRLHPEEYRAMQTALSAQAAVYVRVGAAPNHSRSVYRR